MSENCAKCYGLLEKIKLLEKAVEESRDWAAYHRSVLQALGVSRSEAEAALMKMSEFYRGVSAGQRLKEQGESDDR